MLKETFVRFDKDYHYRGARAKGTIVAVKETDAQLQAWANAKVAHETDKDGKKIPESKKEEAK